MITWQWVNDEKYAVFDRETKTKYLMAHDPEFIKWLESGNEPIPPEPLLIETTASLKDRIEAVELIVNGLIS